MTESNSFDPYTFLVKNPGPIAKEIKLAYSKLFKATKKTIFILLPIVQFITDNLSPIDLINWTFTCHQFHSNRYIQRSIITRFKQNLVSLLFQSGHFHVGQNLSYLLHPGLCVLSGSIVLQAILGVRWIGSDVDFYQLNTNPSTTVSTVYKAQVQVFLTSCGYTETSFVINLDDSYYYFMSAANNIEIVNDYVLESVNSCKVQVILMNPGILPESCVNHFDLDIVQNWYDGRVLHINSTLSITRRIAHVHPATEIVVHTIGKGTGSLVNIFLRLKQIHNDGLIHLNLENWNPFTAAQTLKSLFLRIFTRFEKYISRGFNIADGKNVWVRDRNSKGCDIGVLMKRLHTNNKKMNDDLTIHFINENH